MAYEGCLNEILYEYEGHGSLFSLFNEGQIWKPKRLGREKGFKFPGYVISPLFSFPTSVFFPGSSFPSPFSSAAANP